MRKFSYYRHYRSMHKEFSRQHGILDEDSVEEESPRKIQKIEVRMDSKTLTSSLVELVTVNGLPLNILRYPAFQRIVRPIEDGLKPVRHLDPNSIKPVLRSVSEEIQKIIVSEIDGKLVCVKVDLASRMDRDFICVNIQYVKNNLIIIRTLGVIELHVNHTAANLTAEILKILDPYGIDIRRVLTVTSDNANNIVATVTRLQNTQQEALNDFDALLCAEGSSAGDTEPDEEDTVSDDDTEVGNVSEDRVENRMEIIDPILQGVRCAAHTLQLAVNDTIKTPELKNRLASIRSAVKTLRKLPYKRMFEVSKQKKPKLDCLTRWSSTYKMVNSLLEVKDFICSLTEEPEEMIIDNDLWEFIQRFAAVFKPVAEATTKLQGTQVTFGDFFLIWERCTFEVKNTQDEMALTLASKMDGRRTKLMDNPSFLAAIYLDQRINFRNTPFMTKDQKEVALVSIMTSFFS